MNIKFYQRLLLVILSIALAVWSFPLADIGWLAWFALVPALVAVYGIGFKQGYILGQIFGSAFIYFTVDWFAIFGWEPHWVGTIYFGVFYALFFGAYGWFTKRKGQLLTAKVITYVPFAWLACEWLKSSGVLAFTWGFLGLTQYKFLPLVQVASIAGVFGISFIVIFVNNIIAQTLLAFSQKAGETGVHPFLSFPKPDFFRKSIEVIKSTFKENPGALSLRKVWALTLAGFIFIIGIGAISMISGNMDGDYFKVGVVQPNIPQEIKWQEEGQQKVLSELQNRTVSAAKQGAEFVVWPETCLSCPLMNPVLSGFISSNAVNNKIDIITGITDIEQDKHYNAAIYVNNSGGVVDKYYKIHLVPMSEYFPLPEEYRKYKIFDRIGSYTHGKKMTVFESPRGKFSTLICFESMFDYLARRAVNNGAQFLTVITNDAWFLRSNCAKTHFIMAEFRAVENRVWVVQCANTGISGIVDPYGRVKHQTEMFVEDSFTGEIQANGKGTIYTKTGNWLPMLSMLITVLMIGALMRERKS